MAAWFLLAVGLSVFISLTGLGVDMYEADPYVPYDELIRPEQLLQFKWSNCNNKTRKAVSLTSLSVKPDPIQFGGMVTVSGAINVSQDVGVSGEVLSGDMKLKMKVGPGYKDMCALFGPQICHKSDLCGFLKKVSKHCPPIVKSQGNNCTCPIKKNVYGIKNWSIVLPAPPVGITGSFVASLSLKDKAKELACFELEFCVKQCN